jgi:hypothetical protein
MLHVVLIGLFVITVLAGCIGPRDVSGDASSPGGSSPPSVYVATGGTWSGPLHLAVTHGAGEVVNVGCTADATISILLPSAGGVAADGDKRYVGSFVLRRQ